MSQTDFNRDGDLFKCCDEPCGCFDDATAAALERARVVGVLDAWVRDNPAKRSHMTTGHPGSNVVGQPLFACCLTDIAGRTDPNQKKRFVADSEDAARAAAAKAIEAGEV
jgi:hypothetical protein